MTKLCCDIANKHHVYFSLFICGAYLRYYSIVQSTTLMSYIKNSNLRLRYDKL